jgi:hypothetical protein
MIDRITKLMHSKTRKQRKEILERVFNKLYKRALELAGHDYCQVKCGTCVAARLTIAWRKKIHNNKDYIVNTFPKKVDNFNGCCVGCKHLGKNGCTVEALACRAWICGSAYTDIRHNKSKSTKFNPTLKSLSYLNHRIHRWALYVCRGDRKQTIEHALETWKPRRAQCNCSNCAGLFERNAFFYEGKYI